MDKCRVSFPNPRGTATPMQGKILDMVSPRLDDQLENHEVFER